MNVTPEDGSSREPTPEGVTAPPVVRARARVNDERVWTRPADPAFVKVEARSPGASDREESARVLRFSSQPGLPRTSATREHGGSILEETLAGRRDRRSLPRFAVPLVRWLVESTRWERSLALAVVACLGFAAFAAMRLAGGSG